MNIIYNQNIYKKIQTNRTIIFFVIFVTNHFKIKRQSMNV